MLWFKPLKNDTVRGTITLGEKLNTALLYTLIRPVQLEVIYFFSVFHKLEATQFFSHYFFGLSEHIIRNFPRLNLRIRKNRYVSVNCFLFFIIITNSYIIVNDDQYINIDSKVKCM